MKYSDFFPVKALMVDVGRQIVAWRSHDTYRCLHHIAHFKTEADLRAHDLIFDGLMRMFPNVVIVSEESSEHDSTRPDAYWLIDPIDGTASWFDGFDGFVTQAAYIEHGVPQYGIVHAPVTRKTWTAVLNGGAHLNDKLLPMLVSNERLIMTDNTCTPHGVSQDIMALLPTTGYFESGSLGLKSVLVADGTVDLFVKDVCVRDWDIAPAAAILHEVGGQLSLAEGSPYLFKGAFEKTNGFIVARDAVLMSRALNAFALSKNSGGH